MSRYYCRLSENNGRLLGINHEYITFTNDFEKYTKISQSLYRFFSLCSDVIELKDQKYNWVKHRDGWFNLDDQEKLMIVILSSIEIDDVDPRL